jgi:hypothetical protein
MFLSPSNIHLIRHVRSAKAKRNSPRSDLGAWSKPRKIASGFPSRQPDATACPNAWDDGIIRLIFCTNVGYRAATTSKHAYTTLPQDRDSGTSFSAVSSHRWSVTEYSPARRV